MTDVASTERPVAAATQSALLLRVYGGRLDGAEQRLGPGGVVRVGHDFDNMLVLRGRGTAGNSLALHLQGAAVRVHVLTGRASLLRVNVGAGSWVLLPPYVPLALGEYFLAVGEPGSPRWAEVPALLAGGEEELPPAGGEPDESLPVRQRDGVQRWLHGEAQALERKLSLRDRPGLLLGAAAALAALVAAPSAFHVVRDTVNSPQIVESRLAEAGFSGLQVRRDPTTQALVVEGRVPDDQAIERLRRLIGERYGTATLNVTTLTGAAAAVNGLLQSQGVDAEAVPTASGIAVHSEFIPADRMAALKSRIAADLPGTGPIRFVRDQARGPRDLQYFFASNRYGLASLVDGDPGYIVTADGQYWFAGALLPTGHRLVSVGKGEIRFERDGLVETLRVQPQRPPVTVEPVPASPPASLASQPTTTAATFLTSNAG